MTLDQHRQVEERWLREHPEIPWLFPPVHLHDSLLDRLRGSAEERQYVHAQALPYDVEIEISGNVEKRTWIIRKVRGIGVFSQFAIAQWPYVFLVE